MILINSYFIYLNNGSLISTSNNSKWEIISSREEIINLLTQQFEYIKEFHKSETHNKYNITFNYLQNEYNLELELIEPGTSNYLITQYCNDHYQEYILFGNIKLKIPPLELLCLIKKCYVHIDINWSTNIKDYHTLKSQLKINCNELLRSIYQLRLKETIEKYPPVETKNNKDYSYIREYIKYRLLPLYQLINLEPLFMEASLEDQLNYLREEIMVLTIDEFLLPVYSRLNNQLNYQNYYELIIQRICTTLTKGFFREFIIDHYYDVIKCPKNLNDICAQIQLDQYYDHNIFTINEIFCLVFDLLDYRSIYNLSLTDLHLYNKLNNSEFKKRYLDNLLDGKIAITDKTKIFTFSCHLINNNVNYLDLLLYSNYISSYDSKAIINNIYYCIVNIHRESKYNTLVEYELTAIDNIESKSTLTFIDKSKILCTVTVDLKCGHNQYLCSGFKSFHYYYNLNINGSKHYEIRYFKCNNQLNNILNISPIVYSDQIFIYLSFIILNKLYNPEYGANLLADLDKKITLCHSYHVANK